MNSFLKGEGEVHRFRYKNRGLSMEKIGEEHHQGSQKLDTEKNKGTISSPLLSKTNFKVGNKYYKIFMCFSE